MQKMHFAMMSFALLLVACGTCPPAGAPQSPVPTSPGEAPAALDGPRPWIAPFGKLVRVTGVFVEKGQSYEEQNLVHEPYAFELRAVEGRPLREVRRIRYVLHPTGPTGAAFAPVPAQTYAFEAYESLIEPALGSPFLGPHDQRRGPPPAFFEHVVHLRLPPSSVGGD